MYGETSLYPGSSNELTKLTETSEGTYNTDISGLADYDSVENLIGQSNFKSLILITFFKMKMTKLSFTLEPVQV